jgi:hypothetical protein
VAFPGTLQRHRLLGNAVRFMCKLRLRQTAPLRVERLGLLAEQDVDLGQEFLFFGHLARDAVLTVPSM